MKAAIVGTVTRHHQAVAVPLGAHVIELAARHEGLNGVGVTHQQAHASQLHEFLTALAGDGREVVSESFEPECFRKDSLVDGHQTDHAEVDS